MLLCRPLEQQMANMECNAVCAVAITHHFLTRMVCSSPCPPCAGANPLHVHNQAGPGFSSVREFTIEASMSAVGALIQVCQRSCVVDAFCEVHSKGWS